MVHSIMRHVAETTGCNLEQLYGEVAWPLYKLYGHAYNAFAAMITDAEAEAVFQRLADEAHGGSPPPILSQAVRDGILVNIRWADSRGGSGGVGWLGGGGGGGGGGQTWPGSGGRQREAGSVAACSTAGRRRCVLLRCWALPCAQLASLQSHPRTPGPPRAAGGD